VGNERFIDISFGFTLLLLVIEVFGACVQTLIYDFTVFQFMIMELLRESTSTPEHMPMLIYNLGLIPILGTVAIPPLCEGD
jgi:hypothetical protein